MDLYKIITNYNALSYSRESFNKTEIEYIESISVRSVFEESDVYGESYTNLIYDISKYDDGWFIVYIGHKIHSNRYLYQCDQLDGLKELFDVYKRL